MTSPAATRHRRARTALAVGGLAVALAVVAYLWPLPSGPSFMPMIVCLHPSDIACSDDYFSGRDQTEHLHQLVALLIGLGGLVLIGASGLWSRRLRGSSQG